MHGEDLKSGGARGRVRCLGSAGSKHALMHHGLPTMHERCDLADANADKLLQMVTKLLDLEKLEAGLVELAMHDFNLQEILDSSVQLVSEQLSAKALKINAPTVALTAFGDKDALVQVMTKKLWKLTETDWPFEDLTSVVT